MKWLVSLLCFVGLRSESCKKQENERIPACIKSKIEAIQQQPRFNPPATVYRYKYQDRYVYLFSSNCCDQYNYAYDNECNVVCAPSGGFTGKGDGKCPNFEEMASDKTLIWKDAR